MLHSFIILPVVYNIIIVNLSLTNKNTLTYLFLCLQVKKTASTKKNRTESLENFCKRYRNDAKQEFIVY